MSTALYRRYRSRRFGELVGQDHIATTLRHEVRDDHLAHAYLFTGIRGTGKTSTARILARAVNCDALADGEPCNECAACVEVSGGAAVDVLEIDAASNRGIDEIRDLRERVKYLPASLRRKVYIIDEAHMLTTEAWNAFLKTLEEPPDHVLFILATTEPHKVPDTVRSRVQRFDFRRVSTDAIEAHLTAILRQEEVEAEVPAIALLARAGQGSVRDALSLLDQALAGGDRPLTLAGARRALGLADPESIHRLIEALPAQDAATALRTATESFAAGADPRLLLQELSRLARAAALVAIGYAEGAGVDADDQALCERLALAAPASYWTNALDLLAATEAGLRQPVDSRLLVEHCLLRLSQPSETVTLTEVLRRLEALETRVATPSATSPAAPPAAVIPVPAPVAMQPAALPAAPPADATASAQPSQRDASAPEMEHPGPLAAPAAAAVAPGSAPVDRDTWLVAWPRLVEAVDQADRMLAAVVRDCKPREATRERLVVSAPYSFHHDRIKDPAKLPTLVAAVAQIAGGPVEVEIVFEPADGGKPKAPSGGQSDVTKAALEVFKGSRMTASRLRDTSYEG